MPLKFAIFDFDMTLIDSIVPLMTSANLLAKEFGLREVTYEEVYQAEVSAPNCTFESLWADLWGHYEPQWLEAYQDHLNVEEYKAMTLFPTGRETLEALYEMKVPMGMASNRDNPRKILKYMGLEHFFQAVVGQFDVANAKPDPEMLLKTMELMNAAREETLYVCDSTGDLTAAGAAGIKTFAMTTGGHTADRLRALGAWKTGERLIEVVDLFQVAS